MFQVNSFNDVVNTFVINLSKVYLTYKLFKNILYCIYFKLYFKLQLIRQDYREDLNYFNVLNI